MTLWKIDFAVNDVIVYPTGTHRFLAVTASPRGSNVNVYRKHIKKHSKRMYSAFVGLVTELGAGMVVMIDQGKQDSTQCSYVPAKDCERAVKDAFTKATSEVLWGAAEPAIEQFQWPNKVPVLAMSMLDEPPSFFFVHDFSESKKPKRKGFAVV